MLVSIICLPAHGYLDHSLHYLLLRGYGQFSNRKQMESSKINALPLQKNKNKEAIATKNDNANTLIINVLARIIKYIS